MNGRHRIGHVGDADQAMLADAVKAAPNFTQDEVDYLKKMFPVDLAATPQTMDEALAVSHNCATGNGILSVINHMQAVIDARKPR